MLNKNKLLLWHNYLVFQCSKLKKLKLFFLIFLPPVILALPYPIPPWNTKTFNADLQKDIQFSGEKMLIPMAVDALGGSFSQQFLNIKTESMPGYVCLNNKSETYFDGQKMDSLDFLDGKNGGAISIPLIYDGETFLMYVPIASTTCKFFISKNGFAGLDSKVEVKGILPYGRPELQSENGATSIRIRQYSNSSVVFKMDGEKGYKWQWRIYGKNFLLLLIGWVVLLSSIIQVAGLFNHKK
ncbi:hypothetical protein EPO17_01140 [Patescibacteria group bacterium]|nr:MAG: hypothetical protein EPO17_01140 [Patescibacteria group bacterium]